MPALNRSQGNSRHKPQCCRSLLIAHFAILQLPQNISPFAAMHPGQFIRSFHSHTPQYAPQALIS